MANARRTRPFSLWDPPTQPFYQEPDLSNPHVSLAITVDFQSITAHPLCQNYSVEELRALYYAYKLSACTTPVAAFAPARQNLVRISLPQKQRTHNSPRSFTAGIPAYGTQMVTFRVGTEPPKDFVIHEALVLSKSPFVAGALKGDWKEAKARIIPLTDDDPEIFQLYQEWLYSNSIASNHPFNDLRHAEEYQLLVKAYALGEKLMDAHFKDAIITSILDRMEEDLTFDPRLSSLVYETTPPDCPLRKLWVHVYIWCGSPNWLNEDLLSDPVHADLLYDISKLYMTFWNGVRPDHAPFTSIEGACAYHEHPGGVCVSKFRY